MAQVRGQFTSNDIDTLDTSSAVVSLSVEKKNNVDNNPVDDTSSMLEALNLNIDTLSTELLKNMSVYFNYVEELFLTCCDEYIPNLSSDSSESEILNYFSAVEAFKASFKKFLNSQPMEEIFKIQKEVEMKCNKVFVFFPDKYFEPSLLLNLIDFTSQLHKQKNQLADLKKEYEKLWAEIHSFKEIYVKDITEIEEQIIQLNKLKEDLSVVFWSFLNQGYEEFLSAKEDMGLFKPDNLRDMELVIPARKELSDSLAKYIKEKQISGIEPANTLMSLQESLGFLQEEETHVKNLKDSFGRDLASSYLRFSAPDSDLNLHINENYKEFRSQLLVAENITTSIKDTHQSLVSLTNKMLLTIEAFLNNSNKPFQLLTELSALNTGKELVLSYCFKDGVGSSQLVQAIEYREDQQEGLKEKISQFTSCYPILKDDFDKVMSLTTKVTQTFSQEIISANSESVYQKATSWMRTWLPSTQGIYLQFAKADEPESPKPNM